MANIAKIANIRAQVRVLNKVEMASIDFLSIKASIQFKVDVVGAVHLDNIFDWQNFTAGKYIYESIIQTDKGIDVINLNQIIAEAHNLKTLAVSDEAIFLKIIEEASPHLPGAYDMMGAINTLLVDVSDILIY